MREPAVTGRDRQLRDFPLSAYSVEKRHLDAMAV
jgi:hypothetical protein